MAVTETSTKKHTSLKILSTFYFQPSWFTSNDKRDKKQSIPKDLLIYRNDEGQLVEASVCLCLSLYIYIFR